MSKESETAWYEFIIQWHSKKGDEPIAAKDAWDGALSWCRPLAIAAIKAAKARKKRSPRKPVESSPTSFVPPAWLPVEVWSGFEEMRKRTRKPLTDRARQLTVSSLLKLKAQGEDPIECLNQSVQRAWQGVFAVAKPYQSGNGNGNGHHSEPEERPLTAEQKRKAKESSERVLAKYREEADRRQGLIPTQEGK